MALNEHDREDLLRDGRTMIFRGECDIDGCTVLAGFRDQGQLSLYCGADPVFQFNAKGQLRRTFFSGKRFAAEHGSLVELVRESRGGKVQFIPTPIDKTSQSNMQSVFERWIQKVSQRIHDSNTQWRVVGEDSKAFQQRVAERIECYGLRFTLADSPNA